MTEYKDAVQGQFTPILVLMLVLLLIAVVIAVLGIVNTLALSVIERTREIGLIRAVGGTRQQVRSMVRWESVIVTLIGTFCGLGIGVFFGWCLTQALAEDGLTTFVVPVPVLVVRRAPRCRVGAGRRGLPGVACRPAERARGDLRRVGDSPVANEHLFA